MITSALIGTILSIINTIIGFFPDMSAMPDSVNSAFSYVQTCLNNANAIIDVNQLLLALFFFFSIEITLFSVKGFFLLWKMIRG